MLEIIIYLALPFCGLLALAYIADKLISLIDGLDKEAKNLFKP